MATALLNRPASTDSDASTEAPAQATSNRSTSPLAAALITAAACVIVVWVAVTALLLIITTTSTLGAFGVGAFAAFWLGGGFGAIFGSAAAFGQHH